MKLQGLLLFATSFPNIVFGAIILMRNARSRVNQFFATYAFSVALWALGLAGYIFSHDKNLSLHWAQTYYIAAAIIATTFLGFSLEYAKRPLSTIKTIIMATPLAVIIFLIAVTPRFLLSDLVYRSWGKEIILNKTGYIIYSAYFVGYVSYGFIVILRELIRSKGIERIYLKYIFVGLTLAFSAGAAFNLVLPFFGNYRYIWIGPLFTVVYVAVISYAIVRHRLFDIRLVVARSLAYLLAISVLIALYSVVSLTIISRLAGASESALSREVLNVVLIVFTALSYGYVKRFFDKITNSIFYRDAYDTQLFLGELNKLLVSTMDLTYLLDQTSSIINNNMKPSFTVIGLRETDSRDRQIVGDDTVTFKEKDIDKVRLITPEMNQKVIVTDRLSDDYRELHETLSRNDVAVIIRLVDDVTSQKEGIGYLALGSKKSGNPYNKQDMQALEIIANELVIAIQNALRFEEIEKFNVTLQQKIDSATSKLERNNEKLKALDETKDEFISMASHQLRTPLTSVKGYLSMVLEGDAGKITAPQRKMLDQAFVSSQRMVFLIADLLNVSRLRTGKFVLEPVRANLADIVEGEVDQLKETAKGRNLKLKFVKPKGISDLMLDETKIRQVVMNFMDNAIYYTPGGGDIKIELTETPKSIEYTVTDGGIGVPKSEQHNLFTKFYRANNAQKTRPDGTGLGLFMAKKVIIAHGGGIVFKSQEGKGSTFGFVLDKTRLKPQFEPTDPK